jgi:hypothetical protein
MKKKPKSKAKRPVRKAKAKSVKSSRHHAVSRKMVTKKVKIKPKPIQEPSAPLQRAADEVPTLEQVTITCANCGRPFKVLKLKGLSLEGTICQRCSFGETELPESFGG